jgi:predicted ATP-dependent Lon-type protease
LPKHKFTAEESKLGAQKSVGSRRRIMKQIQKLTGMELDAGNIQELMKLASVFVATPAGQIVIAMVAAKGLLKIGVFNQTEYDILIGVIVTAEFVAAVGSSNIVTLGSSLTGALTKLAPALAGA